MSRSLRAALDAEPSFQVSIDKNGRGALCTSRSHPEAGLLRLRGLEEVNDEVHLAAAAQNQRKIAKVRPRSRLATA